MAESSVPRSLKGSSKVAEAGGTTPFLPATSRGALLQAVKAGDGWGGTPYFGSGATLVIVPGVNIVSPAEAQLSSSVCLHIDINM